MKIDPPEHPHLVESGSLHPIHARALKLPVAQALAVSRAEAIKINAEPLLRPSERSTLAVNHMLVGQAIAPRPIARVSQPRRGRDVAPRNGKTM